MAYARVGSAGGVQTGTTSVICPFAQATTAGNLLIAWVTCNNGLGNVTTASAGWVQAVGSGSGSFAGAYIFYKPNCGASESSPTFNNVSATNMFGTVSEFSGGKTSSPLDPNGGDSNTNTLGSLLLGSANPPDVSSGELFVICAEFDLSKAGTHTSTFTLNNSMVESGAQNNDAASSLFHYRFSWSVAPTNAASDQVTIATDSMNLSKLIGAIASFEIPPPYSGPFNSQEGSERSDPWSIQGIGQAVKRSSVFCHGEKWARRRSGLVVPA